jgi:CubicO group peptidase (beta-lactamase class C family)
VSTSHKAKWHRLSEYVSKVIGERGVPGAALGILCGGEAATTGFGVTHIDHPSPVTDETIFGIASISKTLTTTLVMRLAEMGKLDLDATVRTYLPDFRVADETTSSQATIRHLLTHTGGWEDDSLNDDDSGLGNDAFSRYVARMANLEQLAPVGTVFSYNNAGFHLLGGVVEVVADRRYESAMKELVFDPLGMEHTLLEPESMTLMHSPQVSIPGETEHMGLSWWITDVAGRRTSVTEVAAEGRVPR